MESGIGPFAPSGDRSESQQHEDWNYEKSGLHSNLSFQNGA
jgi:hypothetical protein